MKALKIVAGSIALIPSVIMYTLAYLSASIWNATKEGWNDGS